MTEKKGIVDRAKEAWHSFRGGDKTNEEALSTFGLDFLKTNTFDKRIEEFKEFNTYLQDTLQKTEGGQPVSDDPNERLRFVQERMIGINERIYKTAIAWITAGDSGWGAKATLAWATLFTAILTSVNHTQELLKKSDAIDSDRPNWLPPSSKYASVSKVEYLFSTVYLKYAQFLLSISYKARDVIPTKVAIVQNIPQQSGGVQQVRTRFPGDNE